MKDEIISTGIDIGTTTTQLIFSRLKMKNTGGFGSVPKVEVVAKDVFYRSPILFTPLIGEEMIDAKQVEKIVRKFYADAGLSPQDIDTGAVIITGETARKRNAKEVVDALSRIAGDFVVAAAGPDLESALSGRGSGAADISRESGKLVANMDIGGGTTNISYFLDGQLVDTACLNIGGRLVKIKDNEIYYISPAMEPFLKICQEEIKIGQKVDALMLEKFQKIVSCMADVMADSIGLMTENASLLEACITNHGITYKQRPEIIVFSGGVASCMEQLRSKEKPDDLLYGDLGILLAEAILLHPVFSRGYTKKAAETVNATVVGAGNYSMEVSGSTITYQNQELPKKNLPVYSVKWLCEKDLPMMEEQLQMMKKRVEEAEVSGRDREYVISFTGAACPRFQQIEAMTDILVKVFQEEIEADHMPILVIERDLGKAIGQSLRRKIGKEKHLICLDGIVCKEGDFIDLGKPVAGGQVIPVVVKTLIFEK